MRYLTKDELLQEIAAGNRTIKGLADKFELPTNSIKGALTKLGISLKEVRTEPEPIIMNNLVASDEDEWAQLYKDYESEDRGGTQAQFTIAYCQVKLGMTPAQAREYMRDNFHYQIITIKFKK